MKTFKQFTTEAKEVFRVKKAGKLKVRDYDDADFSIQYMTADDYGDRGSSRWVGLKSFMAVVPAAERKQYMAIANEMKAIAKAERQGEKRSVVSKRQTIEKNKLLKLIRANKRAFVKASKMNEGAEQVAGWIAGYNGKKLEIKKGRDADSLWKAKEFAIAHFKVPKSKQGMVWVKPAVDEEMIHEAKAGKIMKQLRGAQGPFTVVVMQGSKVISQEVAQIPTSVPAHVKTARQEYPNAKIAVEDGHGRIVHSE